MNVEFIIENYGKYDKSLISDRAQDVAASLNMPMPPRAGETISVTLNGEDYDGRHAYLEVSSVFYIQNKGHSMECDVGAICKCFLQKTWVRAPKG